PCWFRGLGHVAHVGVRPLAAHERDILRARHVDVSDEHAVPVEVPCVLLAQQTGAYPACGSLAVGHLARLRILSSVIVCESAAVNGFVSGAPAVPADRVILPGLPMSPR